MRIRRKRLGTPLGALAVVTLIALAVLPVPRAPAPVASRVSLRGLADPAYNLTIRTTATYGYQPDTIANLPLDTTIEVTFIDDSALPHSFNISSREGVAIVNYTSTTPAELNRTLFPTRAMYAAYVTGLGDESSGVFNSPKTPGWFEFICNVTGHFQMGMFGYIAFGEGLPSNLTPPSGGGPPGFSLGEATGFLVVFAVVFAVLAVIMVRLRRNGRDRAQEESDVASPILPRPPPPP